LQGLRGCASYNFSMQAIHGGVAVDMYSELKIDLEWRARFGPFTLLPAERLLERDGVPIRLGGRALDILVALVDAAGETVGKKDLLERVWPNMVVEEGSLRFHIVAIRKALGDGGGINRYIVNTANKGYTFVARVERQRLASTPPPAKLHGAKPMPALSGAMIGRLEEVGVLLTLLLQRRFVTIMGSGGIGKTTVAVAVSQAAMAQFGDDVHFVDLSTLSNAGLVHATIAAAVGLVHSLDDLRALRANLAERRCLILLDCCEHVVDEAAELAEVLIRDCPQLHILATSRESLRAMGEFIYKLQPLAAPPKGEDVSAALALEYPAVRLFVERAEASGIGFELNDTDAPLVSQLCRDLQGIALAIELAAGRIEALGLKAITSHFDASATLAWHGRRTAVARHQTLGATLDWSFQLLSTDEQQLLCRLAIFTGGCTLDAALAVGCFELDKAFALELIASLVAKSLVTVDAGGASLRYRILDATKFYCRFKLLGSSVAEELAQRHASYMSDWARMYAELGIEDHAALNLELGNLRAALDYYFEDAARTTAAIEFAAELCPLLMQLSQVTECVHWAQAALAQLPSNYLGTRLELRLQGALAQALMYSGTGKRGGAEDAYRRSVAVAEQLSDHSGMLHLLNGYTVLLHREGRYADALNAAYRAEQLLGGRDDLQARAIVDSLLGVCLHLVGRVHEATEYWTQCCAYAASVSHDLRAKLGFDYHIRALCGLARSMWLSGQYSEALVAAEATVHQASVKGHAITYCITLIWGGSVFTYSQDASRMEWISKELECCARRHGLEPYRNVAHAIRGQILILRGQAAEGVECIRAAVADLHADGYAMFTSVALTSMAKGLSDMSLHAASIAVCDDVERSIKAGGDWLHMPELLTTRGICLAAAGRSEQAEQSLLAAIEMARTQGVKSAQLRAAVVLAQQWTRNDRRDAAVSLLSPLVTGMDKEVSLDLSVARDFLR